jgi:hypothetical protein
MNGHAQGSVAVVPELGFVIKPFRGVGLPCFHVLLLVANGASRATILSAAASLLGVAVSEYPAFSPKPATVLCTGGHVSARILASVKAHSNSRLDYTGVSQGNGEARANGYGYSYEIGVNTKIIHLPASVHGAITLGGDTNHNAAYSASCSLDTGAGGGASLIVPAIAGNANGAIGVVESGNTIIPATPGVTAVPSSGLYLTQRGIISEPHPRYDRTRVILEIVDFANVI